MKKIVYFLAIVALSFSCKEAEKDEGTPKDDGLVNVTKAQFQSGAMEIASPANQDFDVVIKASGTIDVPPENRAKVTSFMSGYVKTTKLLIGDKVVKGQPIVTLESTDYLDVQKEYLEVAEQINYLKSEYERQKTLFDEKITSQKNYLKAESDYRRAKGMYQSLRAKLILLNINPSNVEKGNLTSRITIFAPISGDVTVVNATIGMLISPSDVIVEIVNNNDLHLELSVFEKDILKVKMNQKIKFTVPEASKEVFEGEVHLVGKSIEGKDRTINVHGHLDDAIKQKLLTGMFVEAAIVIDSKKGLAVPADAVITENNKNFILLLDNEKTGYSFKKVPVSLGGKLENFVEILPNSIINTNSKILTKGVFDVSN
jgi:cobalt-zinc-cadmium efflux system membrane fusion protein